MASSSIQDYFSNELDVDISELRDHLPSKSLDIIKSFNYAVLMGDSLTGKSLLMARTVEPDLVPDSNYTPTNGFAKYTVETKLGDVEVVEISGQTETWSLDLKSFLVGANLVIILTHGDGASDFDWEGLVSASKPRIPIIKTSNLSVDEFRGILSGLALKTYPFRDMFSPNYPNIKAMTELYISNNDESLYKEIHQHQDLLRGTGLIMQNAFSVVEETENKCLKKFVKEEKKKKKKEHKRLSKKSKNKSNF